MRIGFLTDANVERLDWARQHGFGSISWNRFETSPAGVHETNWKPFAEKFAGEAASRGIRITSIGAHYRNPLDPAQSEGAKRIFHRAIDVASHIGVKTVCGFPGAVIKLTNNPKGDNPVYKPYEDFLPRLLDYWEPIAKYAADKGVRLGFEHCPMGEYHLPVMGFNMLAQPAMWERFFNDSRSANMGLEWDASHLMCQLIDPVENLHRFGSRVFHVHAKDAYINKSLLAIYGICHHGVAEHRMPGLGQANWSEIIHALFRAGYDSDVNIEGWHDPVFRDHPAASDGNTSPMAGLKLEEAGLLVGKRTLEQFVPKET